MVVGLTWQITAAPQTQARVVAVCIPTPYTSPNPPQNRRFAASVANADPTNSSSAAERDPSAAANCCTGKEATRLSRERGGAGGSTGSRNFARAWRAGGNETGGARAAGRTGGSTPIALMNFMIAACWALTGSTAGAAACGMKSGGAGA